MWVVENARDAFLFDKFSKGARQKDCLYIRSLFSDSIFNYKTAGAFTSFCSVPFLKRLEIHFPAP